MNEKQFNKLILALRKDQDKALKEGIEKYVNGGIRHLTTTVQGIEKKMDDHIIQDKAWKEEAKKFREEQLNPIVETSENFTWLGKLVKGGLALLILFAGALAAVKGFFR